MIDRDQPLPSKTLGEEIYRRLRSDVLSGRLKPGQRLPFRDLSASYGIGIAPLREAMARLTSEQLVDFEGQRGFTVSAMKFEDLEDLAEQRINLYLEALKRSIARGDENWECEVLVALHMLERCPRPQREGSDAAYDEWETRHERFHHSLIAACGSRWLINFSTILSEQYGRYRRYLTMEMSASDDYWERIRVDHKLLVDRAIERDVEGAVNAARDHLSTNFQQMRELYNSRITQGDTEPAFKAKLMPARKPAPRASRKASAKR